MTDVIIFGSVVGYYFIYFIFFEEEVVVVEIEIKQEDLVKRKE